MQETLQHCDKIGVTTNSSRIRLSIKSGKFLGSPIRCLHSMSLIIARCRRSLSDRERLLTFFGRHHTWFESMVYHWLIYFSSDGVAYFPNGYMFTNKL